MNQRQLETARLLKQNGFSFDDKSLDAFDARLEQEGVEMDETGSFWSASGEPLVTLIYRLWGEPAPAPKPAPQPAPSREEIQRLSPDQKIAIGNGEAPPPPAWAAKAPRQPSAAECAAFLNISVAEFEAKYQGEDKLRIVGEVQEVQRKGRVNG